MSKDLNNNTNEIEWYNNPNLVTSFIIGLIALIVLLSQSFAIKNNLSPITMLGSILNHNIMYLLVAIYFIALKTKVGKKYFDFLNVFLIILYALSSITSLLTVFQSFGLASLLGFGIDILVLIYLIHTLLRDTRVWMSANLSKSPFNEITNTGYFNTIVILAIVLLAVDLVSSTSLDGTILSILDTVYIGLFCRYIFLYSNYLDSKKKALVNVEEVKNLINESVNNFVEEHKLDEAYDEIKEKVTDLTDNVIEKANDVKDSIQEKIEDAKLDEKFDNAVDSITNFADEVKDGVVEFKDNLVEKYDLDEKMEKAKEVVSNFANDVKEEAIEIKNTVVQQVEETGILEKKNSKTNEDKTVEVVKTSEKKEKVSSKPKSEITSRNKNAKKNNKINKKSTDKKVSK